MFITTLLSNNTIILLGVLLIGSLSFWIYKYAFGTDITKLAGIPELPGARPFYGHLKVLGNDHATEFQRFGQKESAGVVQAKLGNRRVIVLNTFEAAQEWIIKNATATIDRPLFWTFHGVLSKSQGKNYNSSFYIL